MLHNLVWQSHHSAYTGHCHFFAMLALGEIQMMSNLADALPMVIYAGLTIYIFGRSKEDTVE